MWFLHEVYNSYLLFLSITALPLCYEVQKPHKIKIDRPLVVCQINFDG